MSLDTQIREAERADDIIRLTRLLIRAGFVKYFSGRYCPHCEDSTDGYGAWPDGISTKDWAELHRIGLPYRCCTDYKGRVGCGKLYVLLRD